MDPTSSWLLPRSAAIGWMNEKDAMSSRHLWWGPPAPTFWDHWDILVLLIMAKTKVERIRETEIPHLELCAAVLLKCLVAHICSALKIYSTVAHHL